MFITDDGIRLHIELEMPENKETKKKLPESGADGKCPLVIVIHGFTGHMEEPHILAVSQTFIENGFAVLRAEMYGHGQSGGTFRDHTLFKWMTNVMTVIDYGRSLDFVSELYLCGHSQGGLLAILAGALKRDVIKELILLSPAAMIPEACRAGEILGTTFDPDHIPEELENEEEGWVLGGNYVRVAQLINVEDAIDRYDGQVVVIHGDEDESVPYEVGVKVAERYKHAQMVPIPGDSHCFDYHLDLVTAAIGRWCAENA